MHKRQLLLLVILILLVGQPGWSCGGGGTCYRNTTHGKFTRRSNEALLQSRQNATAEARIIEQYTKLGYQLESKKKWADAEQSFRYVLGLVSRRDGPGSFRSVPALEHLAMVSRAQNKFDQAIGFQKTACLLIEAKPSSDKQAILDSQLTLANLFIQKHDYMGAENTLSDAVELCNAQSPKPLQHRTLTYRVYAKVLRELHKDSEADAIETVASATNVRSSLQKSDEYNTQVILTQTPVNAAVEAHSTPEASEKQK